MGERKYCSKCQGHPKVDKIEEGYKTCSACRAEEKDTKRETHAVIEKTYAETNNQRTRTHMSYL